MSTSTTKKAPPKKRRKPSPEAALRVLDQAFGGRDSLLANAMRAVWPVWHGSLLRDPVFLAGLQERGYVVTGKGTWRRLIRKPRAANA